ncbi:hypothetical protein EMCRGX_G012025 [Ephydatia muelleri]|eukprot:Em0006g478a
MNRYYRCILLVLLSIGLTTAEVTIFPLRQVVAPNVTVMFNCSEQAATILINNSAYSNYMSQFTSSGITFQNNAVTVLATKGLNNTSFQCIDITMTLRSGKAVLIVAGPPSSPEPRIRVFNSISLNLSWDEPFTQSGFEALLYTVRVSHAVSEATVGLYEVVASHRYFIFTYSEEIGSLCYDTLIFYVTATNQIGVSGAGNISSRFPVAQGPLLNPPELHVALTNFGNEMFDAEILVKFPPEICWYFRINYTFSITRLSSGAAVLYASARNVQAHTRSFVTFTVNNLTADDVYIIVARIELIGGDVVQTNSSIVMSSSYLPHMTSAVDSTLLPSSVANSQESLVPLGYWVGYVCIAIVLFGAAMVLIGVFIYLRYRKQANKTLDPIPAAVTQVDVKNQTKVASSLVCNPIYEGGAVYETVPETQTRRSLRSNSNTFSYWDKHKRTSSVGVGSISSSILETSCNDYARREEWVNVSNVSKDEQRYIYT